MISDPITIHNDRIIFTEGGNYCQRYTMEDTGLIMKTKDKLVIAFDGPAASGKGTIAQKIAFELRLPFLDTGLLYRAIGFLADKHQYHEPKEIAALSALITDDLIQNQALRDRAAGERASQLAAFPEVRAVLKDFQINFANQAGGAVLDGRDIGTVIAPNADLKFFITAKPEVRAHRRWLQLVKIEPDLKFQDVLMDILRRDERDQGRSEAPLIMAKDAHLIDTTEMSIDEAIQAAQAWVRHCCGPKDNLGSNQIS